MTKHIDERDDHRHIDGEEAETNDPPRFAAELHAVERQVRDARRRAHRHWYADGLPEIVIGIVFAALGIYFAAQLWIERVLPAPSGPLKTLLNLLLPVIVVVAALAGGRFIRAAKERLVYPRVGFVRYPQRPRRPFVAGAIGGLLAASSAALLRRAPGLEVWVPALQGFIIGGGLVALARFARLPRLFVPGLFSALAGVVISLLGVSSTLAGALFFGAMGLVLLAGGGFAFRRFLSQTSPAGEGEA
jgi:hypothetical protein